MADLTIYDSQGNPIRGETGGRGDSVSDLFFDGVRFAIDARRQEAVCFFRAKDNPTARSEQYYAVYEYANRSELGRLVEAVRSRVEGEYGMHLDTENEDTRFFELLEGGGSATPPGDPSTLDDLEQVLSEYHQAKVGVGDYRDALGLFSKFHDSIDVSSIAVADNASGRSLSSYDLVVETGSYVGLEFLGDTQSRVQGMREQRRRELGYDVPSDDGGPLDSLTPLQGAVLFGGIGVLLVIAALYGSCVGLHKAPLGGALPGPACGPSVEDVGAELSFEGGPVMTVTGNLTNGGSGSQISAVVEGPNNGTVEEDGRANSSFAIAVSLAGQTGASGSGGAGGTATTVGGNATATTGGSGSPSLLENGTLPAGSYTVRAVHSHELFGVTVNTVEDSDNISIHRLQTLNASRDGDGSSLDVSGRVRGPTNESTTLSMAVTGPDGKTVANATENVTVGSDGTVEANVSVPDNRTVPGVYTVEGTVDNSTATDTVQFGQVDSVAVTSVDRESDPNTFSLRANTTAMPADIFTAEIVITHNGSELVNGTAKFRRDTGDRFGVKVPVSGGINDGTYRFTIRFAEESDTVTYEVTPPE